MIWLISPEFILLFPTDRLFLIFFDIDFALYLYGVAKYFYNYLFHIYLSVFFHIYLLVCFKHFIQSWYYLAVLKHFNIWSEAPHVSKHGVISGPYFPVFGQNTGQYGPEITWYFDSYHAWTVMPGILEIFILVAFDHCLHPLHPTNI